MAMPRLDSFTATNFRAFKRLEIPKFHQVNLIVGKNGAGKSCLLEALYVYAKGGAWNAVTEVLSARGEMQLGQSAALGTELTQMLDGLGYLFFGRNDLSGNSPKTTLGDARAQSDRRSLTISVQWMKPTAGVLRDMFASFHPLQGAIDTPYYVVSKDGSNTITLPILDPRLGLVRNQEDEDRCAFVSSNSLAPAQLESLWDAISLTEFEGEVVTSLGAVARGVSGLSLVATLPGQRQPIVRIKGAQKPVPLKSLGDGTTRMMGLSLAAVNARDGILLIDEIENGLHYSVQPDMWKMLFRMANSLNLQVFATSHSWDCIQAFQQVASERKDVEGELIRLDRKGEEVVPTIFDESELEIVTREQIEVR